MSSNVTASGSATTGEKLDLRLTLTEIRAIRSAAHALGLSTGDYIRQTLTERTEEILHEREMKTVVPAELFDKLVASLDEPMVFNAALEKATREYRAMITTASDWP